MEATNSTGFTCDSFKDGLYETREALLARVHSVAFDNGFACSIVRSDTRKICIACSRSGKYRKNPKVFEPRKYLSGTSKRECPFKLKATKNKRGWTLRIVNDRHNHEQDFEDPSCGRARLTTEEKDALHVMSKNNTMPTSVYLNLRANNERFCGNAKAVHNAKYTMMQKELDGKLPMQAMLDDFKRKGYKYNYETGAEGQLTKLAFTHPHSLKLIKMFSNIFLLDCTYKTNRHGMPLLNVVGVTSTNQTFTAFNCFLDDETAQSYTWAMEQFKQCVKGSHENIVFVTDRELALMTAIKTVFPTRKHVLCAWHIEKNVLANCVGYFTNTNSFKGFIARWTALIQSPTVEDYYENFGELERYCHGKPKLISYLENTWLRYKERFVRCFVNQILHFGHTTTSRVEGSHWSIKHILRSSTGDLPTVTRKMETFLTRQFDEIASKFSKDRRIRKHPYDVPVFKDILDVVSGHAIRKLFDAYENLHEDIDLDDLDCKCTLRTAYGIPCQHEIARSIKMNASLNEGHFHDQWRLSNKNMRYTEPQACPLDEIKVKLDEFYQKYAADNEDAREKMLKGLEDLLGYPNITPKNPDVVRPRSRSKKPSMTKTTKREPSFHEHVFKIKKSPKCSYCGHAGHNVKCPKRQLITTSTTVDITTEV